MTRDFDERESAVRRSRRFAFALVAVFASGFLVQRTVSAEDAGPLLTQLASQSQMVDQLGTKLGARRANHLGAPAAAPRCENVFAPDQAWVAAQVATAMQGAAEVAAKEASDKQHALDTPTPENVAAHQRGTAILDRALQTKRWTEGDKQRFSPLRRQVSHQQWNQLVDRLLEAANQRKITVEMADLPY